MSRISQAQQRLEKIERFHKHAGETGYDDASFYFSNLGDLYEKAKTDVKFQIGLIYEKARKLMADLKERKENLK